MKVAILGFGTVGSSVARILCDLKPDGLELSHVFNRGIARKKADWVALHRGLDRGLRRSPPLQRRRHCRARRRPRTRRLLGAQRSRSRQIRRHRQQKTHRQRRHRARSPRPLQRRAPALWSSRRRRHSRHSRPATGTRRRPHHPHRRHPQRHLQLHPQPHGRPAQPSPTFSRTRRNSATPKPIPAKTWTATTPAPSWSSSPASRSAPASTSNRSPAAPSPQVDAVDLVYAHDLDCTIRQISKAELLALTASPPTVGPMLVPLRSPLAWSR